MKRQHRFAVFCITLLLALSIASCVSVKLPSTETQKAQGIQHAELSSKFRRFFPEHLDAAWENPQNGNSISYFTECTGEDPTGFKNIQKGLIRSIKSAKIERELNIQVAGEKALRSIVSGQVDGRISLVDLIIFSKDKCVFILTYVGTKDTFLKNKSDFESFYKSFEVNP